MTLVEILYLHGCPGHAAAVDLVERIISDASLAVTVRHVEVVGDDSAQALRFLGSPTVRVDGRDVSPDADGRNDFAMQCRLYSVNGKLVNTPAREWIERALGLTDATSKV